MRPFCPTLLSWRSARDYGPDFTQHVPPFSRHSDHQEKGVVRVKRYGGLLLALIAAGGVLVLVGTLGSARRAQAFDPTRAPEIQERLLDGTASFELTPTGDAQSSGTLENYTSSKNDGCGLKDATNIKVNQNCLNLTDPDLQGRGQAQNETSIAIDPSRPEPHGGELQRLPARRRQLLRRYCSDGGRTGATRRRRWASRAETASAARAPVLAGRRRHVGRLGHEGNAYLSCQMFMRGDGVSTNPDLSSAFYVFRSTGNGGASWNFPARPVAEHNDVAGEDARCSTSST